MRIFALLTDAYGGHGGIAVFNRDVLEAFCSRPDVTEVVALPRAIPRPMEPRPAKLKYVAAAAGGQTRYLLALARHWRDVWRADMIYCAHINLSPLAWCLGKVFKVPVLLATYGIDAWQPTGSWLTNRFAADMQHYFAISRYTKERFSAWSGVAKPRISILPNAINIKAYGMGEKSAEIIGRLGIGGKTVLMTLGRLVSKERAKGFDEVMELLPTLRSDILDVIYVIGGAGEYRAVLEQKASDLGISDLVVFAGYVEESEKANLYRVADAYVMPSRGEGFGFVFLEAMACGIPVVASSVDGSRDAVRDGSLGLMVDPDDHEALRAAILQALRRPRRIPEGLHYFSVAKFRERLDAIVDQMTVGRN